MKKVSIVLTIGLLLFSLAVFADDESGVTTPSPVLAHWNPNLIPPPPELIVPFDEAVDERIDRSRPYWWRYPHTTRWFYEGGDEHEED